MLTLLATLMISSGAVADSTPTARAVLPAPMIQVSLNSNGNFMPGALVNVRVETAEDGYLIVFRVDGDGRIRVLFPLDPDGDAFVRGGKEYELRGRGDRSTFLADDQGGNGMVYAALAHQSYNVRDFSANGHWDYDALRLPDSSSDAENDLTAIVARMTGRSRFDYDAVGYRVQDIAPIGGAVGGGYYPGLYDPYYNPRWRCLNCGWGYPGIDIAFGYSPYWDPWLYSPWGYSFGYNYGYYGYNGGRNWWYDYPVGNPRPVPQVPPGTRSRPRPSYPAPSGGGNIGAPRSSGEPSRDRGSSGGSQPTTRSAPPPAPPPTTSNPGTRSRPRPGGGEFTVPVAQTQPSAPSIAPQGVPVSSGRPVFRQPQVENAPPPRQEQPQSRPVYREPPRTQSPPPQQREPVRAPPPQQSSGSGGAARSAPPPSPPPASGRSRPVGGGN